MSCSGRLRRSRKPSPTCVSCSKARTRCSNPGLRAQGSRPAPGGRTGVGGPEAHLQRQYVLSAHHGRISACGRLLRVTLPRRGIQHAGARGRGVRRSGDLHVRRADRRIHGAVAHAQDREPGEPHSIGRRASGRLPGARSRPLDGADARRRARSGGDAERWVLWRRSMRGRTTPGPQLRTCSSKTCCPAQRDRPARIFTALGSGGAGCRYGAGSASVKLLLTSRRSARLNVPLRFTSFRKFDAVTDCVSTAFTAS